MFSDNHETNYSFLFSIIKVYFITFSSLLFLQGEGWEGDSLLGFKGVGSQNNEVQMF